MKSDISGGLRNAIPTLSREVFLMAKLSKEELTERMKGMSKEDRTLFREVLQEIEPDAFLSGEEVSTVREMLGKIRNPKAKSKNIFDVIFGE